MLKTAVDVYGGPDILQNNATATGSDHISRDGAIHELDTELWGPDDGDQPAGGTLGAKHTIPNMLERGEGVIVDTASGKGLQAEAMRAAYGTSKAAVIGVSRNVATQCSNVGFAV